MRHGSPSWHYADVGGVRQEAGVGDQSNACANGSEGCPGPNADVNELPCPKCFLEDDGDRQVATDGGVDPFEEGNSR